MLWTNNVVDEQCCQWALLPMNTATDEEWLLIEATLCSSGQDKSRETDAELHENIVEQYCYCNVAGERDEQALEIGLHCGIHGPYALS